MINIVTSSSVSKDAYSCIHPQNDMVHVIKECALPVFLRMKALLFQDLSEGAFLFFKARIVYIALFTVAGLYVHSAGDCSYFTMQPLR